MATPPALGLLLVGSIAGCAASPAPPIAEAKTLEPVAAPPAPSSPPSSTTPATAASPVAEPDAEYTFEDFKGASGDCYHAVHCLAPAPSATCPVSWHKAPLHTTFSAEQSKKKQRTLCCYRTTVCEHPVD